MSLSSENKQSQKEVNDIFAKVGNAKTKSSIPQLSFNKKNPSFEAQSADTTLQTNIKMNILKQINIHQIDLSAALKDMGSASSTTKKNTNNSIEQFDIPFTDCETESESFTFECKMDIKDIMLQKHRLKKSVSEFGKVLCLKYKRRVPYIVEIVNYYKQQKTVFNFDTPSPDDLIHNHLRRK